MDAESALNFVMYGCRRVVNSISLRALLIFLIGLGLGGCLHYPQLELSHAELAGDEILVEVHAYTSSLRFNDDVQTFSNSKYYLLRFPLKPGDEEVRRPFAVATVPWGDSQESSYSADRLLRVRRESINVIHSNDWAIQVARWNGEYQGLQTWELKHRDYPPFAASNDGRYLALLEGGVKVLDTKTLEPVAMPGLDAMFKPVLELRPNFWTPICLTQNLDYVVFKPAEEADDGSKDFTIDGKSYSRKMYCVFVERKSGHMGTIPVVSSTIPAESANFVNSAAESNDGGLLLLYYRYLPDINRQLYSIRDKNLGVRYQLLTPRSEIPTGKTAGRNYSWDPAEGRMLCYDATDLNSYKEPLKFHLWEYESGKLSSIKLDVASAFRKGWREYEPEIPTGGN